MIITVGVYKYIFVGSWLLLWYLMPLSKIVQLNMWRSVANHWQTQSHNVVSSTPRYLQDSNSQI